MATQFQHQPADRNLNFSRSEPMPQHGKQADPKLARREPRTFEPKPGEPPKQP